MNFVYCKSNSAKKELTSFVEMIFDEDAKLFGFTMRYSGADEEEELKAHIVNYVTQQQQSIIDS